MSFEVIAACCLAGLVPSHALPDNHLERAVQVYVHPDRIEIHYHLGLTDRQVGLELAALALGEPVPKDPAAALHQYEELIAPLLAEQVQLSVDGRTQPLSIRAVDRQERHHQRFVVECEAPVRLGPEPCRIEIRDMTSPGVAGVECRRIALRGRGDVVVAECSGEPTLVRVPRQPAPARAYRPNEPSRTIVAVCRLPATASEADAASVDTGQIEPAGSSTTATKQPAVDATSGKAIATADEQPRRPAVEPSDAAPSAAPGTGGSISTLLVAAGIVLILAGCAFAAAARGSKSRRRAADDRRGP